jgi:hypothetical protein
MEVNAFAWMIGGILLVLQYVVAGLFVWRTRRDAIAREEAFRAYYDDKGTDPPPGRGDEPEDEIVSGDVKLEEGVGGEPPAEVKEEAVEMEMEDAAEMEEETVQV